MLSFIFFARRQPHLSAEEFARHWRDVHGPLVARHLGHHLVRYQQWHRHRAPGDDGDAEFDGAAVVSFASEADFHTFLADPAYAEVIRPDEQSFIDLSRSKLLFCDDPITFVGAPGEAAAGIIDSPGPADGEA